MTEQATKRYVMVFGVISILSFLTVFLSDYTGCANAATCGIGDTRVLSAGLTGNEDGGDSDTRIESLNDEYAWMVNAGADAVLIGQETPDAGEKFTVNGTSKFKGASSFTTITATGGTITGITDLALADGGTGASTASAARTNLGVAIGSDVQAWDADLDTFAALAKTDGNFIVGTGVGWTIENGATARTSLGLGSLATQSNVDNGDWSGTDLSVANGGTGASSLTDHYVLVGSGTGAITPVTPGTSGWVLTSNGTGADPTFQAAPTGGATYVYKAADECITSNATHQADDDLQFTASANTKYAVVIYGLFNGHATPDLNVGLSVPSGTANFSLTHYQDTRPHDMDESTTYLIYTDGTDRGFKAVGVVDVGGTGGTFSFDFSQNTSDANNTCMKEGSWLSYMEL